MGTVGSAEWLYGPYLSQRDVTKAIHRPIRRFHFNSASMSSIPAFPEISSDVSHERPSQATKAVPPGDAVHRNEYMWTRV